jgi:prepilin-type N-terminal cleavage/methylation domain-containing protein
MPKKTVKGFTLIELLVVLVVIGIFSTFAYPNITSWITDREVRGETYKFVAEIEKMKSKATNGEYALAMIHFTDYNNGPVNTAFMKKYYMTRDDYNYNYSGSNYVSGNNLYTCDYDTRNQRYQSAGTYTIAEIRHWPNIHMCISKDGTKRGVLNQKNPDTGKRNSLSRVIFCSANNTTTSGGSNRCNDSNKNDYRYMVTWDVFTNLKVYKFSMNKNQWCINKTCRYMSDFN